MSRKNSGLTLVEVIVVSVIIAVLIALLAPTFLNARVGARKSECVAFLHQIHVATEMYRSDHDGSGKYGDATAMGLPSWPPTRGVPALNKLRCSVAAERKDRVLGTGYFTYFAQPELDLLVPSWKNYSTQYRDASMLYADPFHNRRDIALDFGDHVTRFVMGVNVGGSIVRKNGKGDWMHRLWFNREPE